MGILINHYKDQYHEYPRLEFISPTTGNYSKPENLKSKAKQIRWFIESKPKWPLAFFKGCPFLYDFHLQKGFFDDPTGRQHTCWPGWHLLRREFRGALRRGGPQRGGCGKCGGRRAGLLLWGGAQCHHDMPGSPLTIQTFGIPVRSSPECTEKPRKVPRVPCCFFDEYTRFFL